jgi:hypothetical protein
MKYLIYRKRKFNNYDYSSVIRAATFRITEENNYLIMSMKNNPSKIPWETYWQERRNDILETLQEMNII